MSMAAHKTDFFEQADDDNGEESRPSGEVRSKVSKKGTPEMTKTALPSWTSVVVYKVTDQFSEKCVNNFFVCLPSSDNAGEHVEQTSSKCSKKWGGSGGWRLYSLCQRTVFWIWECFVRRHARTYDDCLSLGLHLWCIKICDREQIGGRVIRITNTQSQAMTYHELLQLQASFIFTASLQWQRINSGLSWRKHHRPT